jgi:hypothetical protein
MGAGTPRIRGDSVIAPVCAAPAEFEAEFYDAQRTDQPLVEIQ